MAGLYDRHLDAFLAVARTGSFSKAAQALYISPNALIKQINRLEADLGACLFDRTARGTLLTAAGKAVYEGARQLVAECDRIEKTARSLSTAERRAVRLATSTLRPSAAVAAAWHAIKAAHPGIALSVVPIDDDPAVWSGRFELIGQDFDVVSLIEPSRMWPWYARCQLHVLNRAPAIALVPYDHPLSGRARLTMDDLRGETLVLAAQGVAPDFDRMRERLARDYPEVHVESVPPYDLVAGNASIGCGWITVIPEDWASVYPDAVGVPCDWDFTITRCLMCAKSPPPHVQEFVHAVVGQFRGDAGRARTA